MNAFEGSGGEEEELVVTMMHETIKSVSQSRIDGHRLITMLRVLIPY